MKKKRESSNRNNRNSAAEQQKTQKYDTRQQRRRKDIHKTGYGMVTGYFHTSFKSLSRFRCSVCCLWRSFLLWVVAVLWDHLQLKQCVIRLLFKRSECRSQKLSSSESARRGGFQSGAEVEADSLVIGRPRVKHVGLQFGEVPLLVSALPDLHVQQVRVDGGVVDLHQPLLDGLSCKGDTVHSGRVKQHFTTVFCIRLVLKQFMSS